MDHNLTPSVRVENQYIEHTERNHSRIGSHVSHEQDKRNLKLKNDHLRKNLRRSERNQRGLTSPSSGGSDRGKDRNYWQRSRTPPNESYSVSLRVDKLEK